MGTKERVVLDLKGVSKQYGKFYATREIDLDVRAGEVHVLFGENGAGKSTLIKMISGVARPDAGEIRVDGTLIDSFSAHRAREAGVSCVFQEFSLAPDLTVEENLFLGCEIRRYGFLDKKRMRAIAARLIADLGFELSLNAKVSALPRARQQMVEITKALMKDLKVLILDEPTASLTELETRALFGVVEKLKARGVAIIYVTHRMKEINQIADRITVLRNGSKVTTVDAADVSDDELIELMVGRPLDALFPTIKSNPTETVLEVHNLTTPDGSLCDISLSVRSGEIVGIAGLIGSGNSLLLRTVFGLNGRFAGRLLVNGQHIASPRPDAMLGRGLCYFPSDRVREGLALPRSVRENATITKLADAASPAQANGRALAAASSKAIDIMSIQPTHDLMPVGALSGGNRQKVMLARGVTRSTSIYLFDEPTVGIDVSAKISIYNHMKSIVEHGGAILMVSSELLEITSLPSRVYVMSDGRIVSELEGSDLTEDAVLRGFFKAGTAPASMEAAV